MEKISIIIPLYNCAKHLKHTVKAVIKQTHANWEMIIVNDASTDDSLEKAMEFADDSRIKILNLEKNAGVGAARNAGIALASGRYVAFLDSDDLWSNDKLEKQLAFMQKNSAAISHTGYAFINEKGSVLSQGNVRVDRDVDLEKYLKTTQVGMSSVMYDRKQIHNLAFPTERELCEDAKTWVSLMKQGIKFQGLNETLMLYRVRSHQLSGNKINMALNTLKRYLKEDDMPAYKRLHCFVNYAYNGAKKRMIDNDMSDSCAAKFNCKKKER